MAVPIVLDPDFGFAAVAAAALLGVAADFASDAGALEFVADFLDLSFVIRKEEKLHNFNFGRAG